MSLSGMVHSLLAGLLLGGVSLADASVIDLVESGKKVRIKSELESVSLILDDLARTLGFGLIQKGRSEHRASVSCVSRDLRDLLRCILGGHASFMIEAAEGVAGAPSKDWSSAKVTVLWPSGLLDPVFELKRTAPDILGMLASADPEVRAAGLDALTARQGLDPAVVLSHLKSGLGDSEAIVRSEALLGLAPYEDDEARGLILGATHDNSPAVRLAAIDALIPSDETREALEAALQDSDPDVQELARSRLQAIP